ncbi:MAG: hypothetical protein EBU96_11510 [Actinobacteria bacterium]|nr:hypothetical protein [Actinomycetota bacterium]
MKLPRVVIAGFAALVLAGCSLSMTGMVDLDPVPYSFHPPSGLESKLSVEPMTTVTYTPDEGQPAILMGAYYMPESVFDQAANPNEPPLYGSEVARADGYVLAVTGPQDSMYDPESQDGKNIGLLYDALYDPESYMPK